MQFVRSLLILFSAFLAGSPAFAWDYQGHRAVNELALASLPPEFPSFVREAGARERIAFLAGEPDRWRNNNDPAFRHGSPEHFLDMESLSLAGTTPENLSEFRYVFAAQLAAARVAHPEQFEPIDADKNKDHTRELIGLLPWTITDYYGRLKSAFSYLKTFEEAGGTPEEIANARANVIYVMGVMGHYVGDGSQPLHTTKYHNGWFGENPNGYTTARTFHAWIDGGFIAKSGGISSSALSSRVQSAELLAPPGPVEGRDPIFSAVMSYLIAQHTKVEPLYDLEKQGKLSAKDKHGFEGKPFIENQILIGGHMLGSLWLTAWRDAPPDTYLRSSLVQRNSPAAAGGK